ncbi:MAG: hypothetical protein L0Y54_17340 [Sporichthyaceae bacterium]|nr:hypothetical protein [Sporichthyaceae bacterium]
MTTVQHLGEQAVDHGQLSVPANHRRARPAVTGRLAVPSDRRPGDQLGSTSGRQPYRVSVAESGARRPAGAFGHQHGARRRRFPEPARGVQRLADHLAESGIVLTGGDHLTGAHSDPRDQRRSLA